MRTEETILRFISGEMTEEKNSIFISEMEKDSSLRQSVEHSRRIKRITDQKAAAFTKDVRAVIESNRKNTQKRFLWMAASISVLLAASLFYVLTQTGKTPNEVVALYLHPFPDLVTERSDEQFSIDLSGYNAQDYNAAVEELLPAFEDTNEPLIGLYLGVSYLFIGQPDRALVTFEKIDQKDQNIADDLIWYKSLALIKMDRHDEAGDLLKTLKESQSGYSKKSSQLLEDLD